MEQQHRFTLASNKVPKITCPSCGAKKHWQQYLDTITGELLPQQYGRCDNENKCGAWNDPYKDGYTKAIWQQEHGKESTFPEASYQKQFLKLQAPPAFIPFETLTTTLRGYEANGFIQNLLGSVPFPFAAEDLEKVISAYYLGTIIEGYMKGAITFPFIDSSGNIRAVQAKTFDEANHTTGTSTLAYILEQEFTAKGEPVPEWLEVYNKRKSGFSCLFGEHLLAKYPNHTVALVEAPKTAIYGTLYFGLPEESNILWLAVYNKSAFTFNRIQALAGRQVIVFPDLSKDSSTFAEWSYKVADFEKRLPGTFLTISDLLETSAADNDRIAGSDLADYLITKNWRDFRKQRSSASLLDFGKGSVNAGDSGKVTRAPTQLEAYKYPNWEEELETLEAFFDTVELPNESIPLGEGDSFFEPANRVSVIFDLIRQGEKECQGVNTAYYMGKLHALKAAIITL